MGRWKIQLSKADGGVNRFAEYNGVMSDQVLSDITRILRSRGVVEASLFGSMARGEVRADSDVDVLVKFDRNRKVSLFDLASIREELEKKVGRRVDLITKLNKYVEPYVRKDLRRII